MTDTEKLAVAINYLGQALEVHAQTMALHIQAIDNFLIEFGNVEFQLEDYEGTEH